MAWVKLDDSMPTHPKVMASGVDGYALDVAGISYCNRYSTDGFIASHVIGAVLPMLRNPQKVAAKLVEVGRWSQVEGGWLIHDYHDYQPTAEHQREVSQKRAEAGRIGGSKPKPKQNAYRGEAERKQNASDFSNPVPSRPVPSNTVETSREIDISDTGVSLEPATRPRNPWYDACVVAFDMPERGNHEGVFGRIAAVCKTQSHPPEEILKRVALHMATFDWAPTPASVLKRWDELGSSTVTATKEQRRQVESELERMRRRMAIVGGVA